MQNEENNVQAAIQSAFSTVSRTRPQVIVVDGGSTDDTIRISKLAGASQVISSDKGRGRQMNAGADKADGQILLFLHADSKLPSGWGCAVEKAIERKGKSADWGCFETIDVVDAHPWTKWFLSTSVRIRTRVFHRPYGDQAIFVKRTAFMDCGKYPDDWPLLEDVELVRKLRQRFGGPAIVPMRLSTSGRRWKKLGLFQATVINQIVLLGHALGVPVKQLAALYEQTGPRRQCTVTGGLKFG